jgi:hypothetical protein
VAYQDAHILTLPQKLLRDHATEPSGGSNYQIHGILPILLNRFLLI